MKFFAAALALTAFFVGPARAEEPPTLEHGQFACDADKGVCLVRQDDLAAAMKAMGEAQKLLRAQQDVIDRNDIELRTLRDSKGCAKVTPVPKPHAPGERGV